MVCYWPLTCCCGKLPTYVRQSLLTLTRQARTGKAALSGTGLMSSATDLLLTVTNSGAAPVTGNALSYGAAYRWARPASYNQYNLALAVTSCVTINVRELKSGNSFSALTFTDRPQVSCSGVSH
jgi:hypothetical protein